MALPPQKLKLPGIGTVIGVLSGKGGVGKTFFTANLGCALSKLGKKVGILDADISCPDLFKILGITTKLSPTEDQKIVPAEKFGMKAVSMAGLVGSEDEPIMWRGPIVSRISTQLMKESIWGDLDFLLIDYPSGASDATVTILQNFAVDGCIVLATPQSLSVMDAKRTLGMLEQLGIPVVGICENMRGEMFGEGLGSRLAESKGVPFLGSIPMRRNIAQAGEAGTPAVLNIEELEMIFSKITRVLLERMVVE